MRCQENLPNYQYFHFRTVKTVQNFPFPNCQNFTFQTVKISLIKLSKFPLSNCQNFPYQIVKISLFKLSKFPLSNCQNFPYQTVKISLFKLSKISLSKLSKFSNDFGLVCRGSKSLRNTDSSGSFIFPYLVFPFPFFSQKNSLLNFNSAIKEIPKIPSDDLSPKFILIEQSLEKNKAVKISTL